MQMINDVVTYTSGRVRIWTHMVFKIKYSHAMFEYEPVKKRCEELLREVSKVHRMEIDVIGFDRNHVHLLADIGLHSAPEAVKLFKGRTAKYLLEEFPTMKHEYFWGSGFWNPSYYAEGVSKKDYTHVRNYVLNQGKKKQKRIDTKHQSKLSQYTN